jgi:hypothetical protein
VGNALAAGLTPRPWRRASLLLALLAVLAALWNHPVLFDLRPGSSCASHILARTPEEAGAYVLELGLASGATTFGGLGTPPLRLPATVRAPDPS